MAPALRIPVSLDMASLQQQTQAASSRVDETLRTIGRQFTRLNGEVLGVAQDTAGGMALAWSKSLASTAVRFTVLGAGAIAAFKLVSAAIGEARERLAEMVEVADKSRNVLVSPEFFQAFVAQSRKLKVEGKDLEDALTHAFQAVKEELNPDWTVWDQGLAKISAVEKAMREFNFELFDASQKSQGLQIFQNAKNTEDRVRGVLTMMIDLDRIGQHVASLDLGAKLFGPHQVDLIRQGRTSAQEMLDAINAAARNSDSVFPAAMVNRAKEIDDKLKIANQTLDRELKPSWENLETVVLKIKDAWAEVVKLAAEAVRLANNARPSVRLGPGLADLTDQATRLENRLRDTGLTPSQRAGFEAQLRDLQSRIARIELEQGNLEAVPPTGELPGAPGVPLPRPRPPEAPQAREAVARRDRFEASADSIEKRTAALQAETATIDLNTAARERAKIAAELQTVAMQINKEAGLGENVVTAEQRTRIEALADAYGRAAAAIEKARSPLATFARESANLDQALNRFAATSLDGMTNALADVVTGSKTAADAFKALADSVINDLARIAIRKAITGPLASLLFGAGGGINVGGFPGPNPFSFGSGGFTGPGGRDEPAGIVHRGEFVFDQDAVNRIGVANLARLQRGYAGGGLVGGIAGVGRTGGAPKVDIQVIQNAPGVEVQAQSPRRRADGGFDLKLIVDAVKSGVADDIARGGTNINSALAHRYGLNPAIGNQR